MMSLTRDAAPSAKPTDDGEGMLNNESGLTPKERLDNLLWRTTFTDEGARFDGKVYGVKEFGDMLKKQAAGWGASQEDIEAAIKGHLSNHHPRGLNYAVGDKGGIGISGDKRPGWGLDAEQAGEGSGMFGVGARSFVGNNTDLEKAYAPGYFGSAKPASVGSSSKDLNQGYPPGWRK